MTNATTKTAALAEADAADARLEAAERAHRAAKRATARLCGASARLPPPSQPFMSACEQAVRLAKAEADTASSAAYWAAVDAE